MSTSAIKSSLPGVGTSPPTSGHSMLPMNVVAQKVVPGTESGASMKPLNNSAVTYATLQPANQQLSQPLSLVQEHRAQVYQNNLSYASNDAEKEDNGKSISNGVEVTKVEIKEQESVPDAKQNQDTSRNNNLSPENPTIEVQPEAKTQLEPTSNITAPTTTTATTIISSTETPAPSTPVQPKVEEKKTTPLNNGSKEVESSAPTVVPPPVTVSPAKIVSQIEEKPAKVEDVSQQPKEVITVKTDIESPTPSVAKSEPKTPTTPRAQKRKSKEPKDMKCATGEGGNKPKRNRVQTQPYQSPLPEIALIVKQTLTKTPSTKNPDDKLIVFYKNEFLAVRNSEGSFYVCQAMQNIYKSSRRIRIRWLSQDKNNGEIYSPDFYDFTDFDCILTNLNLNKIDKNKFQLTKIELLRTENILKRAIDVEAGVSEKPSVTEEHPDGLDLSLFKDESQLKKRKKGSGKLKQRQRKRSKRDSSSSSSEDDDDSSDDETERKTTPKSSRVNKRVSNKALALAKSVAKAPTRAKRALIRGTRSNPVDNSPTGAEGKRNVDAKTPEVKKTNNKPTTSASTAPRTKLRGPAQSTEQASSSITTTRLARRLAATTEISSTENTSTRKKSQGRA